MKECLIRNILPALHSESSVHIVLLMKHVDMYKYSALLHAPTREHRPPLKRMFAFTKSTCNGKITVLARRIPADRWTTQHRTSSAAHSSTKSMRRKVASRQHLHERFQQTSHFGRCACLKFRRESSGEGSMVFVEDAIHVPAVKLVVETTTLTSLLYK